MSPRRQCWAACITEGREGKRCDADALTVHDGAHTIEHAYCWVHLQAERNRRRRVRFEDAEA